MRGGDQQGGPARGDADHARELGRVVANRYVLTAHLGTGRYGEVYDAVDRSLSDPQLRLEHRVELHLLHSRIAQQTRLLQKLESSYQQTHLWAHPNVVKVQGFGCDRGQYFLVMEMLDGVSLRALLDDLQGALPSKAEALAVLRGVGDALKYAHAKGAIHGDIRPETVLITTDSAVKVLDLLPATSQRSVPFFVEDTASNELAPADPRDDVYGLACVAYELFSGRHPFDGRTPLEALQEERAPAPIAQLDLHQWNALERGLALYRARRTASVAAFLAELGITGQETLRAVREEAPPSNAPPEPSPASAASELEPPARAADGDLPVIGDFSGSWQVGATRSEISLPFEPRRPASRAGGEQLRIDPQDARRYAERAGGRGEPRRSGVGILPFALLAAVVAVTGYLNYDSLSGLAEQWLGRPGAGARAPNAPAQPQADSAVVVAPQVVGAIPEPEENAVDPAPDAVEPAIIAPPAANEPEIRSAPPVAREPELAPEQRAVAESPDVAAPVAAAEPPAVAELPDAAAPVTAAEPPAVAELPDAAESPAAVEPPAAEPVAAAEAPVAAAAEPPAPETFEFTTGVVLVSEREAGARVTIRRRGGGLGQSSVVWWASDGTAVAPSDYADLGPTTERFAAGEETRRIYVPIVGDANREGPRAFT